MLSENSTLASYTPNIAAEIDGDGADLIEVFHQIVQGWHGLPPNTRLGFEKAVVAIFVKALEAGIFDEAQAMGEEAAYNLAAVAMFQVLDMVTEHDDPKFLRACLGVAMGAENRSQVEVAAAFHVHPATVSKWARRFVTMLELVPGRGMRREEACNAYSARQERIWEERSDRRKEKAAACFIS